MKRLLNYVKPHRITVLVSLVLVLILIGTQLMSPIVIGEAIDQYISGYQKPFVESTDLDTKVVHYNGRSLTRDFDLKRAKEMEQLVLYKNQYYMFHVKNQNESKTLTKEDFVFKSQNGQKLVIRVDGREIHGQLVSKTELRELRKFDFQGVLHKALIYCLLLITGFVSTLLEIWLLQKMGQEIIYSMRKDIFTHLFQLPVDYFNHEPVGKLVTRVTNDTEAVNELFTSVLIKLFRNTIMIIGYAVVMLSIDVRMTGYAFLMLPIVGGLTVLFRVLSKKAYRIVRNRLTDVNTFLSENLSGMRLIQIFTREEEKKQEFQKKSQLLYKAHFREIMTFAIFRPSIYLLSVVALVIIIIVGSKLNMKGTITVGTLFVFITYIRSFFEPIQELTEQFGTLQSSLASAEKVFTVMDAQVGEDSKTIGYEKPDFSGEIEFKNVWFAYEEEEYVLRDVSFCIKPGEKIAFVGATGAGKTSILNLIGRYYDIQKGQILISGKDIQTLDIMELRKGIGQVAQDVFLFTGTIRNNITLGDATVTDELMIEAAKYVHADDFIQKLPEKYEEPVTERGSTLSAGQRQLLSFARTLFFKPQILVLDEATANIDTETESLITDAMNRLMEGRTTIMVAHRLSTIQHADQIMVMEKGKIRERGTHQELLEQNGIYRNLYDLQLANAVQI